MSVRQKKKNSTDTAVTVSTSALIITFEEAEFLEESGDDEGVTEVKQQPTKQQALVVQVGGVWPRVDVAYRNLGR